SAGVRPPTRSSACTRHGSRPCFSRSHSGASPTYTTDGSEPGVAPLVFRQPAAHRTLEAMGRDLRAAVIGAGSMGANHVRVFAELPGVELVAVCDPDMDRARTVVGHRPAVVFPSLDSMLAET